ncbi:MAG: PorP/SprF family type IX secretion system membrane protein [Bacteroidota bacterium]
MKTIRMIPAWIILNLVLLFSIAKGQDPNYSQWLNAPIYYNPAFTGLNAGVRARLSCRDQWPNLPVDFKTLYFSGDFGDRNLPGSGGIGLMVNRDNEGIGFIKNLSVGLSLSARIPVSYNVICQVGIKGSVIQKWLQWNDFVFSDQLSGKYGNIYPTQLIGPDDQKRIFADFGVGGLVQFVNNSGNFTGTAGFAVDHLFQPDESFISVLKAPLPRKYVGHLDVVISLGNGPSSSQNPVKGAGDPLRLNPGIIFQNQNGMNSLQVGMNALKYNIYLGGYFKTTSVYGATTALMVLAGYRYIISETMNLKFMYSYDIQVSSNLQGTGGAHEISLILEFKGTRIAGRNRFATCRSETGPDRNPAYLECSPF